MGVVRYLCITIVLASLLAVATAVDCNGNGWLNANGACVCNSGYRNSVSGPCTDTFGSTCAPNAATAVPNLDDRFPTLDLDTKGDYIDFTNNFLSLSINGPIVPGRTYQSIEFLVPQGSAPADAKCGLQGNSTEASFWSQPAATYTDGSLNAAQLAMQTCHDRFYLNMHWPYWRQCGFKLTDGGDVYNFQNTFKLTYTDDLGPNIEIEGVAKLPELKRTTVASYTVWVKFTKIINVITEMRITLNNTVSLKAAVTKFEYNPANQVLTFGITTIVFWPNMYLKDTVTAALMGNTGVTLNPTPVNAGDTSNDICDPNQNNCLQYFEFSIQLNSGCDFNGDYTISGTIATCRDLTANAPGQCTRDIETYTVEVRRSDVCGAVVATPTVSGKLVSWTPDMSTENSNFEIGYYGEFTVVMETQNDFNLSWIDIWAVADEDVPALGDPNSLTLPHMQYLVKNAAVQTTGFYRNDGTLFADSDTRVTSWDMVNGPCNITIHDLAPAPGPFRVFTSGFRFRFDPRIFYVPLGGVNNLDVTKGYTLHARGRITYAGNEQYVKRSSEVVEFAFKTDGAEADAKTWVGIRSEGAPAPGSAPASAATGASPKALAATIAPVVGVALVVIAAAVVAAVIIKKKKSNTPSFNRLV